MVDGVSIQHHQLQRPGQLKDPLYFTLDFRYEENNHMDLIQPVSSHAGGVNIYCTCTSPSQTAPVCLPRLERVLDLSMMALLLGLFSTDRLANDMSAVTLVMDILQPKTRHVIQSTAA